MKSFVNITSIIFAATIILISASSLKITDYNELSELSKSSGVIPKKVQERQSDHVHYIHERENEELNKNYGSNFAIEPRNTLCPIEEEIVPCTCYSDQSYRTFMDCSYVTTETRLKVIFEQIFPFPDMYQFYMDQENLDSNITVLSSGIFKTKTFKDIVIRNVNFGFNFDIFDGMTSTLEHIYLTTVPLSNIRKDFSAYTQLNEINIRSVPLEDVYINSPTLQTLYFYSTNLKERNAGENLNFGIMENLNNLEVHYAPLSLLPDISGYTSLSQLDVDNNNIVALNISMGHTLDRFCASANVIPDIEIGSIKVTKGSNVLMYSNQLQYLYERIWKEIFINSSTVSIEDNPFVCGCDIAWIFGSDPDGIPFMDRLDNNPSCQDGVLIKDLDPDTLCSDI